VEIEFMIFQIKIIYKYIMDDVEDYLELLLDGYEIEDIIRFIEKEHKIKCVKIKDKKKVLNNYSAST
jgi:hypothetical protein